MGNTAYCNFPKESLKKPKVGGYFSPNIERIIALDPTIVIMESSNEKLTTKLKTFGIESEVVSITSLENIKKSFLKIGKIIEKEQNAKDLIKRIEKKIQETKDLINNQKILIVFGENLKLDKPIFVSGQNLYFNDIIELSGNKNAFYSTRKGQPILNYEEIIGINPDIIIILAPYMNEKKLTKEAIKKPWFQMPINAGKNRKVYVIDKEYAGIASDRLTLFLDDFKEFLIDAKSR